MKYFDGKPTMPDPYNGVSPMYNPDGTPNEARFLELGGTITDDGQPSPLEKFSTDLNDYLAELEAEAKKLGIEVTVDDFKQAASTMMSSDLIAWARDLKVPEAMIDLARGRILAFIADGSRLGLVWSDIFPPQTSAPVQPTEQVQGELF